MYVKKRNRKNSKSSYLMLMKRKFLLFFYNFCSGTGVHGCHYISDYKHVPFKSNLWIIVDIVCLIFSIVLIWIQLSKFSENTLITNIASTAYPVWKIPFPAVTVCNFNAVYRNNTERFRNILKKHGITDKKIDDFFMKLNILINNNAPLDFDVENYATITKILNNAGYDTEKLMMEVGGGCNRLLKKCWWKSVEEPCDSLFKVIKTAQGFCCSFNYYGVRDVQIENAKQDAVRRFSGASGPTFGLDAILVVEEDQYLSPFKEKYGVDILVHDGEDFPDLSLTASSIMPGQSLTLGLLPSITAGDKNIRSLTQYERLCSFEDEGELEWSSIYSFNTCMSECKATVIYNQCNCIPFFYPNPRKLPVCTLVDVPCLKQKEKKYNSLILAKDYTKENSKNIKNRVGEASKCHCLPECSAMKYETYIDKRTAPKLEDFKNSKIVMFNVHYNVITCIKYSTSLNVTWDMLIASIGGIFGLCIGGSVMSLIELLYHFVDSVFYHEVKEEVNVGSKEMHHKSIFLKRDNQFITPISEYVN